MNPELSFIDQLRSIATHPAARGLLDDAAVLDLGGTRLVLTLDTLVEGVHYLPEDPAETVAWKLVAANVSDLAAKGAKPLAALSSYTLTGDATWDRCFITGLGEALDHFGIALIGGDTVSARERSIGLTLIGETDGLVPSRSGAHEGDALFVTGVIGDAGLGLAIARGEMAGAASLLGAYRTPVPQLAAGMALAPTVSAMMDVSDGLLIDALRLADASGVAAMIDLDAVPLSAEFRDCRGDDRAARLMAATAGDDYQLLFASARPLPSLPCPATRIGQIVRGSGIHLHDRDGAVPLPMKLGWLHQ
ncbi:thiamine-phosphate kinase [Aquisediminimonas profunda]|uniref:thiamine-phosphate kinase n=1 Tax=Aquisediminimonas profunda TaxID=1550733 RepID=UPI001C62F38B|nr:thiamine-phosphate kinase [Aquisediminimonas profunda]